MQMNIKSRVPKNYRRLKVYMFATQPTDQFSWLCRTYKLILSSKIPPQKVLTDYLFLIFFLPFGTYNKNAL